MTDITIAPPQDDRDLHAVRDLCWAFRDFLATHPEVDKDIVLAFYPTQKYRMLLADLMQIHARPKGMILLARDHTGAPLGCGMTHAIDAETSEIKRVFMTPAGRGKGIAERLCAMLVAQAREDGFKRVVLDTSKGLHAAQRLYTRMGFVPRGPYQPIPPEALPELLFYEKCLEQTSEPT